LYGQAFRPAALLFGILLPGMVALALHLVVDAYFAGRGFPPISIVSAVGALGAKIGLNLILVPGLGAPGAAVATTVVYASLLGVKVLAVSRASGMSVWSFVRPDISAVRALLAS
jgi:Na+-driven multidrug efflux pump